MLSLHRRQAGYDTRQFLQQLILTFDSAYFKRDRDLSIRWLLFLSKVATKYAYTYLPFASDTSMGRFSLSRQESGSLALKHIEERD